MNADTITLLIASLCGAILLTFWHRDPNGFDLRHLMMDSKTNRVSLMKTGQLVALGLSSWVLVYETRAGRMTEYLFVGYMLAWSGANLAKRYIDKDKKEQ